MPVRRREILLLEDDLIQTMLVRAALDNVHGSVTNFIDAEEALRKASERRFDLFIVDLGVFLKPKVYDAYAGMTFISSIRSAISQSAPILIASADRDTSVLIPAFMAGADDYVLKSEGIDKLTRRVKRWTRMLPVANSVLTDHRRNVLSFLRDTCFEREATSTAA